MPDKPVMLRQDSASQFFGRRDPDPVFIDLQRDGLARMGRQQWPAARANVFMRAHRQAGSRRRPLFETYAKVLF
jgi:hypothetical protein